MTADVTVIIAAYNVETYIERAINSALAQENVKVEVIVVNDASTDGTAAVVRSITDQRVKLIDLPTNGGPSAARNAGLAAVTTPWVAILDGDDAFAPDRLLYCLTRARAVKADIVADNLIVRREADDAEFPMFQTAWFARLGIIDLASFITHNASFLGGSSLGYLKPIFNTDFLRKNNLTYDTELRVGEDYMLICEALALGARFIPEPSAGYYYTVRKGSISHRLTLDDVKRIGEADKKFLARHKLGPAATAAQKRRERALWEAYEFTQLVERIKQRDLPSAFQIIKRCPASAVNLWRPVWARVGRVFK